MAKVPTVLRACATARVRDWGCSSSRDVGEGKRVRYDMRPTFAKFLLLPIGADQSILAAEHMEF